MRNRQRPSYLHSNIKDQKRFLFWGKKNTPIANEVLGNQSFYNETPFPIPQAPFTAPQQVQNIPQNQNYIPPVPIYPIQMPTIPGMPISNSFPNQNSGLDTQGMPNTFPSGQLPPFGFPQGNPYTPPFLPNNAPFPAPANALPLAPAGNAPVVEEVQGKKRKKTKKSQKTKIPKINIKLSILTALEWLRQPNVSLSISLFFILPILFALSILTEVSSFKFAYIVGSIIAVIWIFWKKPFSDGIRLTLVVTYISLTIVILINITTGISPTQLTSPKTDNPSSVVNTASLLSQIALPTPIPEPETTVFVGDNSGTQQNFEGFMAKWTVGDIEGMLDFISPNWKRQQSDPTNALFTLLLNRRPKEYTIESIDGSASDSARTVTMSALINKFTAEDYLLIRFQILMLKEADVWYVDPSTLGTNFQPTPTLDPNITPTPTVAPRTTVTPKPADETTLYYNPNGGKLYHAVPDCPSVNKKFLPLTPFTFGQLKDEPYKSLIFCQVCGAPH